MYKKPENLSLFQIKQYFKDKAMILLLLRPPMGRIYGIRDKPNQFNV
jgi:hypothetical protein